MDLSKDTVAVITGASSGIGEALACALAGRGAAVVLGARRQDRLQAVAGRVRDAGGRALAVACDVTDRAQVEHLIAEAVREFGHIDLLINNAGRGHCGYVDDTPPEHIEEMFRVNVFPLWYASAAALRTMRPRGRGMIVSIASIAGKIGYPGNAAYVAAKHATVGFNRALRTELVGSGIEAMVVVPGGTITEWAMVAEGRPMLDLFAYERERGHAIAQERGTQPPPEIPLLTAEQTASAIITGIEHPVPELHTHPGTRELALAYEQDTEAMEQRLAPYWLANREGYLHMPD